MSLVLCVPNVSEGRRADIVARLGDAVAGVPGVQFLDDSADVSHHRSVFTFAGQPRAVADAVLALYERAIPAIDLTRHHGEHPGSARSTSCRSCRSPARRCATAWCSRERSGRGLPTLRDPGVPLRGGRHLSRLPPAGGRPPRRSDVLAARMAAGSWLPDFGPSQLHPTAGASAVGARRPLIAFQREPGDGRSLDRETHRVGRARTVGRVARREGARRTARMSRPLVQVTMNVTDYERASLSSVFGSRRAGGGTAKASRSTGARSSASFRRRRSTAWILRRCGST